MSLVDKNITGTTTGLTIKLSITLTTVKMVYTSGGKQATQGAESWRKLFLNFRAGEPPVSVILSEINIPDRKTTDREQVTIS